MLGHTIYFYSKNTGYPVKYIPPAYAIKDVPREIPKYKQIKGEEQGVALWWVEYGGSLDTIHDSEKIKWRLWEVCYGIWDFIKNSGNFKDVENLTLEWVGPVPGKRESRRFEGEYMLTQKDVIEQRNFDDTIAYGGWALDLHPQDNVFSEKPGCNQYHAKGIYEIPLRSYLPKYIKNLFIAGRIISATHVAYGSTRVMGTCANGGQAIGIAAALCTEKGVSPRELTTGQMMQELQRRIIKAGGFLPRVPLTDRDNLVNDATISASSVLKLNEIPGNDKWYDLDYSMAQMIPLKKGVKLPELTIKVQAHISTLLKTELRISEKPFNYTPEKTLEKQEIKLKQGENEISIRFETRVTEDQYLYICFMKDKNIALKTSKKRYSGLLTVFKKIEPRVANFGKQEPETDIGVETFEFWCPKRRPDGPNIAMKFSEPLHLFSVEHIKNGWNRPTLATNAWAADFEDDAPLLILRWNEKQQVKRIVLSFDTDFDHPMESVHMGHPERIMPFCIKHYFIKDDTGNVIFGKRDNHETINEIILDKAILTDKLIFGVEHPSADVPAALFEVRCYGE